MSTLYRERFEHDACGIGAVVDIKGRPSRAVVDDALKIVEKLEHRAGKDAASQTGDGVGILVQVSHDFFRAEVEKLDVELGGAGDYGVGMFFFPQSVVQRRQAQKMFEVILSKEGMDLLTWRDVPTCPEILGQKARDCMPCISQCFVRCPEDVRRGLDFDRRLYVARRVFEQSSVNTYVASLSSRTVVYKGMFLVGQLRDLPIPNKQVKVHSQAMRDRLYRAFGYTYEGVKDSILPMARTGSEPTAAMGTDTPLAVLSKRYPPLFNYFKQQFAQVTNPPIDAIREECVTDTTVYVGSDGNLLEERAENCNVLQIDNPILTGVDLMKIRAMHRDGFHVETVSLLYYKNTPLERAIERLFVSCDKAYRQSAQIFEIVGIRRDVVEKYFTNTVSRVEGIGLEEMGQAVEHHHSRAFDPLGLGVDTTLDRENVVVIGNGDTATDCVATAIRQGAVSMTQLVRKPAPKDAGSVWPYENRTGAPDYGQEEASAVFGHDPRLYETVAKKLETDEAGNLRAVTVETAGKAHTIPAELLLIAAGFSGAEGGVAEAFGLNLNDRRCLGVGDHRTANEKIFAAGDMRRGASLVAIAIAEGRACARAVDEYLEGYTNL